METVRGILAAHRSGISRPGLLAWARLRIDIAMTDAQLEEQLALLGDEVVDDAGFLYLRQNLEASGRVARTDVPLVAGRSAPGPRRSGSLIAPFGVQAPSGSSAPSAWEPGSSARTLPAGARRGLGWIPKAIAGVLFAVGVSGVVGGFFGAFGEGEETPGPTAAPTPMDGSVIGWNEIAVGDCLVLPTEDEFLDVRRIPCNTPHGGEVFHVVDYPNPTTGTTAFPTVETLQALVDITCKPAFASWTGTSVDDQDLLDIGFFSPTEEGWSAGGREVECYLYLVDGSLAERSYRGANP